MKNSPIGIFDSGIGGLSVVKEVIKQLPNEDILYVGDTARVPYGTRGREIITTFALEMVGFLLSRQVKCLVVACNTISATCFEEIVAVSPVPVMGVIEPSVKEIVGTTQTRRVGVIGTPATIKSNVYEREIKFLDPTISVTSIACPLFVPIVEEGLADSDIAELTARHYLSSLTDIDTLHLGCTHYPLLKDVIKKAVGWDITLIDSAHPTAKALHELLSEKRLLRSEGTQAVRKFYVTDAPERVKTIAKCFLGENNLNIQKMTLQKDKNNYA